MEKTSDQHARFENKAGLWLLICSIGLGASLLSFFSIGFILLSIASIIALGYLQNLNKKQRITLYQQLDHSQNSALDANRISELLRGVINSADIPIVATDHNGIIAHTNMQANIVFGIGPAMLGRRADEILTQEAIHDIEKHARQGEPGHARLMLPINGEMRDYDVSADPVPISGGAVLTFRDITELSNAMTLKTDFVANASHELRTPISSIKIASETLAGPAKDDPVMTQRLIEMITDNANRLESLANDLLDLSRMEAATQKTKITTVNLNSMVDRIFENFQTIANRHDVHFESEVDGALIDIETDEALLNLIFRNLVQNAVKFARPHTPVIIRIKEAQVTADRASPPPKALSYEMGVQIEVIDQGIGIPLAHQQRIFERFYQVDDSRTRSGAKPGTGLGLAIVKHACKSLGGNIVVESVPQVGTTMRVDLPNCVPEDGIHNNHSDTESSI